MIQNLIQNLQRPGIEPGPPAWQARILPLNQRCLLANGNQYRLSLGKWLFKNQQVVFLSIQRLEIVLYSYHLVWYEIKYLRLRKLYPELLLAVFSRLQPSKMCRFGSIFQWLISSRPDSYVRLSAHGNPTHRLWKLSRPRKALSEIECQLRAYFLTVVSCWIYFFKLCKEILYAQIL